MTASPSFPPADAALAAIRRVDWRGLLNAYMDAVVVVCAAIVATWQHHRCSDRLRTAAAILAAAVAIGAAWAWETGRPAAARWVRETAWPVARRCAAETVLACRAIAQPPLTV